MIDASAGTPTRPPAVVTAGADSDRRNREGAGHPLTVTPPYLDHHCRSQPYAVTSRIGSITRTEYYRNRAAAARGAEQARRDLALLATRLNDRP